jgi:RNA polymerase sigma-70 factor (ECF subfamily)
MEKPEEAPDLRLITTMWDQIADAHRGATDDRVTAAQVETMRRYAGAIHRYFVATVRDPDAVADLDQEFARRFLRGDFRHADPSRGRFRDYLQRALQDLMSDHGRARSARPLESAPKPAAPTEDDSGRRFLAAWRADLIAHAWDDLKRYQERTTQPYHTALHLRVEHPDWRSHEIAARLTVLLGRPVSTGAARMALHRARERFTEFLLEQVSASLPAPDPRAVEKELIALHLIDYCRPVMERLGWVADFSGETFFKWTAPPEAHDESRPGSPAGNGEDSR